jgi:hypothetical protein
MKKRLEERQLANCCQLRDVEYLRQPDTKMSEAFCLNGAVHSPPFSPSFTTSPVSTPSSGKRLLDSMETSDSPDSSPHSSEIVVQAAPELSNSNPISPYGAWPPGRSCTRVCTPNIPNGRKVITAHLRL